MKKIVLIMMIVFTLSSCVGLNLLSGEALEENDWWQSSFGLIKVKQLKYEYNYMNFGVNYKNNTDKTYEQITITILLLNKNNEIINKNQRSFFKWEVGLIYPEFHDFLKIPIEINEKLYKDFCCYTIKIIGSEYKNNTLTKN